MHAFPAEDIDGSGERRGHRGHEHREAPVLKFLDDECGDESILDLDERRLPHVLFTRPREPLGHTPKERIARESFDQSFLDSLPGRSSCRRAHCNTDEETGHHHEEKREDAFSGEPFREHHGNGPHKTQ
jgi:hypothetical protein